MDNKLFSNSYSVPSICPDCGKPYVYVGDPFVDNIQDLICTCIQRFDRAEIEKKIKEMNEYLEKLEKSQRVDRDLLNKEFTI